MPRLEDDFLREGLKYMLGLVTVGLTAASHGSPEQFAREEDLFVDSFVHGLRTNGYKIVKIDEAS
jgi:hypothetical protein